MDEVPAVEKSNAKRKTRRPLPPSLGTRFIRVDEVQLLTGLGKTAIYERMGAGDFPRPVRLFPESRQRCPPVAWVEAEVRHWMERHFALRDAKLKEVEAHPVAKRGRRAA